MEYKLDCIQRMGRVGKVKTTVQLIRIESG